MKSTWDCSWITQPTFVVIKPSIFRRDTQHAIAPCWPWIQKVLDIHSSFKDSWKLQQALAFPWDFRLEGCLFSDVCQFQPDRTSPRHTSMRSDLILTLKGDLTHQLSQLVFTLCVCWWKRADLICSLSWSWLSFLSLHRLIPVVCMSLSQRTLTSVLLRTIRLLDL